MPASSSHYPKLKSYNLTDRQWQILRAVANDEGTKEIAHRLKLSPKTVEGHWANLKIKLGVSTKLGAALMIHRNQIK